MSLHWALRSEPSLYLTFIWPDPDLNLAIFYQTFLQVTEDTRCSTHCVDLIQSFWLVIPSLFWPLLWVGLSRRSGYWDLELYWDIVILCRRRKKDNNDPNFLRCLQLSRKEVFLLQVFIHYAETMTIERELAMTRAEQAKRITVILMLRFWCRDADISRRWHSRPRLPVGNGFVSPDHKSYICKQILWWYSITPLRWGLKDYHWKMVSCLICLK